MVTDELVVTLTIVKRLQGQVYASNIPSNPIWNFDFDSSSCTLRSSTYPAAQSIQISANTINMTYSCRSSFSTMPSMRTPSEASFDPNTDYFADFDGAYGTPVNESDYGTFEDEPSHTPSDNNDCEEPSRHASHHREVIEDEQQCRIGTEVGNPRRGARRIWRWLRRITSIVFACAIGLIFHSEGY